eukprot:TRINITY_DN911_c0_g7_i1.p1 TRINITY_DN911_c0_g7~~TRINITY_DN911_c0_g7_i1.p1  ORF type:complete len:281 (-),score=103.10 TRINITY_DN911_c0_g7_i1:1745-2587(-)
MGDFAEYKKTSDAIGACISKAPKSTYIPIFSTRLLRSAEESDSSFRVLSVCGRKLSPVKWQFLLVEGLMDSKKKSVAVINEFALKDLTRVALSNAKENHVQFSFGSKSADFMFEKLKPRDAVLWSLLTLFFKATGKYPELVRVNLVQLDKLADRHKFSGFSSVFTMRMEQGGEGEKRPTMAPLRGDAELDEEADEELTEVEAASARLGVLKTLSDSKNLKADYKEIQKKLFNDRQQIMQEIIGSMRDKEKDKKKLLNYTDKIDDQFGKMQLIFRTSVHQH